MGRIENTDRYNYDQNVSGDDYLLGTDAEGSNKTKSYKISNIIALAAGNFPENPKTFRTDFSFFSGSLKVYENGALINTISTDATDFTLDLSKSNFLVAVGGLSPILYLDQEGQSSGTSEFRGQIFIPPMSSDDWYDNLLNSVTNGYGTVTISDVS